MTGETTTLWVNGKQFFVEGFSVEMVHTAGDDGHFLTNTKTEGSGTFELDHESSATIREWLAPLMEKWHRKRKHALRSARMTRKHRRGWA